MRRDDHGSSYKSCGLTEASSSGIGMMQLAMMGVEAAEGHRDDSHSSAVQKAGTEQLSCDCPLFIRHVGEAE